MTHIDHTKGIQENPDLKKDYNHQLAEKLAKVSGRPLSEVEKELGLEPSDPEGDQQ